MMEKVKTAWSIFAQAAALCLIGFLVWQGLQIAGRLDVHEKQIREVKSTVLTIDSTGKQVLQESKGLAKLFDRIYISK